MSSGAGDASASACWLWSRVRLVVLLECAMASCLSVFEGQDCGSCRALSWVRVAGRRRRQQLNVDDERRAAYNCGCSMEKTVDVVAHSSAREYACECLSRKWRARLKVETERQLAALLLRDVR
jgi:hypothetical protein